MVLKSIMVHFYAMKVHKLYVLVKDIIFIVDRSMSTLKCVNHYH